MNTLHRFHFRHALARLIAVSIGLMLPLTASFAASSVERAAPPRDERPPLKLKIDSKPIDRDAADRVSYAGIIEKVSASVVHVYSTKRVRGQDMSPFFNDPMFRRFFGLPGQPGPGEIPDQTQRGLGSGVIITADGYILTNNHVVEGADDVKVSLGDATKRYDAKVLGTDPMADLAVLQIDATDLVPIPLGDSTQLKVGDVVLAIGNPFGVGQSVSSGIVSALGRGNLGIEALEDFIQTDAAINPGNSGGALIDTAGRLVGINTAIVSRSGSFAGVGFAIPVNLVRGVAEQIVTTGRVDRGFLGVAPQDLTPDLAAQFDIENGALLAEVTPDSPAEKAGLQAGDVVTKVNGDEIADSRDLLLTVSQLAPDSKATVEYRRDGKTQTTEVTLARRPDQEVTSNQRRGGPQGDEGVLDGVAVTEITPQARAQLQIPDRIQGALIARIDPSSPAAQQGLQEGDVILELDRQPVRSAEEAIELSTKLEGPKVMVRLFRQGRSLYVVIDESEK